MTMESTASPSAEKLPKKEVDDEKGMPEIVVGGEHDDCYEIDFIDDEDDDDDDEDDGDDNEEGYCYVIDHNNPDEHCVISHLGVIDDEGYENGDEDEYSDSDYDDDDDDGGDEDDSDDDSCYEIDPTEFSPKMSVQVPDDALAT